MSKTYEKQKLFVCHLTASEVLLKNLNSNQGLKILFPKYEFEEKGNLKKFIRLAESI